MITRRSFFSRFAGLFAAAAIPLRCLSSQNQPWIHQLWYGSWIHGTTKSVYLVGPRNGSKTFYTTALLRQRAALIPREMDTGRAPYNVVLTTPAPNA